MTWFPVVEGDEPESFSALAMNWEVRVEPRVTYDDHPRGLGVFQDHLVCDRCGQSMAVLVPDMSRGGYVRVLAGLAADVLRHVREVHCDGGGRLK